MGFIDIFRISSIKKENAELKDKLSALQKKVDELGVNEYYQTKAKIDELNEDIVENNGIIAKLKEEIVSLTDQESKLSKQVKSQTSVMTC